MRSEEDITHNEVLCNECKQVLVLNTDQVAIITFVGEQKEYLCFDCYENEAALNDSSGG